MKCLGMCLTVAVRTLSSLIDTPLSAAFAKGSTQQKKDYSNMSDVTSARPTFSAPNASMPNLENQKSIKL